MSKVKVSTGTVYTEPGWTNKVVDRGIGAKAFGDGTLFRRAGRGDDVARTTHGKVTRICRLTITH